MKCLVQGALEMNFAQGAKTIRRAREDDADVDSGFVHVAQTNLGVPIAGWIDANTGVGRSPIIRDRFVPAWLAVDLNFVGFVNAQRTSRSGRPQNLGEATIAGPLLESMRGFAEA